MGQLFLPVVQWSAVGVRGICTRQLVSTPTQSNSYQIVVNLHSTGSNPSSYSKTRVQGSQTGPIKPGVLLNGGSVFERSRPQYETVPASSFVSVKSAGAKGDGSTDDSNAIQSVFNNAQPGQIVYFDHGAYIITKTIAVPKNIKITGEIWPLIMASGPNFQDQTKPIPVFQVGQPGDVGSVEMSDLIFETAGPCPGAILMEWNVAQSSQGATGLWDVHFRIGGTAGTQLQSNTCAKNPSVIAPANPNCEAAFLLMHITASGSCYLENVWYWVADHELDLSDHSQVNIYNGRGLLVESQGPVWMYGTVKLLPFQT
jgi:glucan 1,3-beta-glucosidase